MMDAWRLPGHIYTRLFRHDVWNIGIVDAPIHTFLTPGARPPVRWLPEPPRGSFLADPFMVETDNGPVILAEGFSYAVGKGHIAALRSLPDGGFGPPTPIITEPVHLSYPYVVRHAGRIFCIPESGTARAVYCYEATAFPYQWERRATLIEGFAALDATIFRHEDRWWLLCSEQDGTPGTTLHAWYAADLLGPWTPHAANPVKRDLRSSRPAGTPFVHQGRLYRPAQDSTRTYGGAVVINRILRLTPTAFAEEAVTTVAPYADGPYRYGLHTLSACGQLTIIDGNCHRFIPHEFRRVVGRVGSRQSAVGSRQSAVAGDKRAKRFRSHLLTADCRLPAAMLYSHGWIGDRRRSRLSSVAGRQGTFSLRSNVNDVSAMTPHLSRGMHDAVSSCNMD